MTFSTITQLADVHSMQSSDHKGSQQTRHKRKKARNNKKGGNKKENANDEKNGENVGGT